MPIFALFAAIALTFAAQPVCAGEKIEFRSIHTNVVTGIDTVHIGDEDGHILALLKASGVGVRQQGPAEPSYRIEIWGKGDYRADGTGKDHGYGKFIFSDGSSYYEEWEGTLADGRSTGTAVYYNGTGRFTGMKGGSKFDCTALGDRFVCEVDGVLELP